MRLQDTTSRPFFPKDSVSAAHGSYIAKSLHSPTDIPFDFDTIYTFILPFCNDRILIRLSGGKSTPTYL